MINLRGKADNVAREQVRAFLYASLMVLSFHNLTPTLPLIVVIKKKLKGQPDNILGTCLGSYIELRANMTPEEMLMTCIHEVIHACYLFPDETLEKCTSTLCAKIKEDVWSLSQILVDGTYKRAAYIAHTKIRYRVKPGQSDYYDKDQYKPVGVTTRYKKGD